MINGGLTVFFFFEIIYENQGAELMGKYGVNVPKGIAVSSVEELRKAIQDVFPNESEVIVCNSRHCCAFSVTFKKINTYFLLLTELRK